VIRVALYEKIVYDAAGQLVTARASDYLIPTASEVPVIETVHLDSGLPLDRGRVPQHG
jgi:carbon-monoxide dehydrogenase large subunit